MVRTKILLLLFFLQCTVTAGAQSADSIAHYSKLLTARWRMVSYTGGKQDGYSAVQRSIGSDTVCVFNLVDSSVQVSTYHGDSLLETRPSQTLFMYEFFFNERGEGWWLKDDFFVPENSKREVHTSGSIPSVIKVGDHYELSFFYYGTSTTARFYVNENRLKLIYSDGTEYGFARLKQ